MDFFLRCDRLSKLGSRPHDTHGAAHGKSGVLADDGVNAVRVNCFLDKGRRLVNDDG